MISPSDANTSSTRATTRRPSAPANSGFTNILTNFCLAKRIAYHGTYIYSSGSFIDARFHWSRFGGDAGARSMAKRFMAAANKRILPILRKQKDMLPMRGGHARSGLPLGVRVSGVNKDRAVVATAHGVTLGTVPVDTVGLSTALLVGCDLRIDLQRAELDANIARTIEVTEAAREIGAKFGAVVSVRSGPVGKGGNAFKAGVSRVPRFEVVPCPSVNAAKHAYEVRMGNLFTARFNWSPRQAMATLDRAEAFAGKASAIAKSSRVFMNSFRSAGHNPKPKSANLPRGIVLITRPTGTSYQASWTVAGSKRIPSSRFSIRRHGDTKALGLAMDERANGLRELARDRATAGTAMIRALTSLAKKEGVNYTAADRKDVIALIPSQV